MVATNATRSFYHLGALGSVMEITDMNEAEVVSHRYECARPSLSWEDDHDLI